MNEVTLHFVSTSRTPTWQPLRVSLRFFFRFGGSLADRSLIHKSRILPAWSFKHWGGEKRSWPAPKYEPCRIMSTRRNKLRKCQSCLQLWNHCVPNSTPRGKLIHCVDNRVYKQLNDLWSQNAKTLQIPPSKMGRFAAFDLFWIITNLISVRFGGFWRLF